MVMIVVFFGRIVVIVVLRCVLWVIGFVIMNCMGEWLLWVCVGVM